MLEFSYFGPAKLDWPAGILARATTKGGGAKDPLCNAPQAPAGGRVVLDVPAGCSVMLRRPLRGAESNSSVLRCVGWGATATPHTPHGGAAKLLFFILGGSPPPRPPRLPCGAITAGLKAQLGNTGLTPLDVTAGGGRLVVRITTNHKA